MKIKFRVPKLIWKVIIPEEGTLIWFPNAEDNTIYTRYTLMYRALYYGKIETQTP